MSRLKAYIDNILHPVLPFMAAHPGMMFLQDNAQPHSTRITIQFLQQNYIGHLPWPSMSTYINPIEHLWV